MIISTARNFIFAHAPKTGGTALALALETRAAGSDILIGDTPKARRRRGRIPALQQAARGRLWKHSTLADIEGAIPADFIDRAFVVTLVRNPWDRMVSYYHWLRAQAFDHPAVHAAQAMEFGAFLRDGGVQASVRANPHAAYVTTAAGRLRCDLFARIEEGEAGLEPLWRHLGFRLTLPVANTSARARDHRGYYDAAGQKIVADICAADIARFGYRFEPPRG